MLDVFFFVSRFKQPCIFEHIFIIVQNNDGSHSDRLNSIKLQIGKI